MNNKLSDELEWRGFTSQTTLPNKSDLDSKSWTFYWGVDPSSDSMTIGNLAIALMVKHFINAGHKAVLLVGGATGMIGDPDGKQTERDLLSEQQIIENSDKIANQYRKLFEGAEFEIVNNKDWFASINYIEFLRDTGKHVPMRTMLNREFVSSRLGEEGSGISYAEFSYSLIQAYDFLHLHRTKSVDLQLCGSDQWGNSIAGVDLIRRVTGDEAHIWSAPLVVNKSTGAKFGKTEEGAVWLDENKTSIYKFYQFWLNLDDESAKDFLKLYTFISKQEIDQIITDFDQDRSSRLAQKTLAYEVTKIVHGKDRADSVVKVSNVLFGRSAFSDLNAEDIELLSHEIPVVAPQENIVKTLVASGLASSNSEAIRFISSGAISINGEKVDSVEQQFSVGSNLLKRGKNSFVLVNN